MQRSVAEEAIDCPFCGENLAVLIDLWLVTLDNMNQPWNRKLMCLGLCSFLLWRCCMQVFCMHVLCF